MGDLVRMPYSEVTATLELLDRLGVTPGDFEFLRKTASWKQSAVARVHKNDEFVWALIEMEQAAKKAGFTADDLLMLSRSEDKLKGIVALIRGGAAVQANNHIIDCDADPFVPEGWKVEKHCKCGQLEWNSEKISLFLSERQKDGKTIEGNKLRKELEGMPVHNANVLDYLLKNPHLIPEDWKGKAIFFWGTIYRYPGGYLCVRCLGWDGSQWYWYYYWLDVDFGGDCPAALRAS